MKITCLMLLCAVIAGCSSVSHSNTNSTRMATASTEPAQYHVHLITEYSDGATKFLEMSPDEDADSP
jgi:uncharacterized protein YceK